MRCRARFRIHTSSCRAARSSRGSETPARTNFTRGIHPVRYSTILLLGLAALLSARRLASDSTGVVRSSRSPEMPSCLSTASAKELSEHGPRDIPDPSPPGEYRIGAARDGFDPAEREVFVASGTEQTLQLSLAPEIVMIPISAGCFLMGSPPTSPSATPTRARSTRSAFPAFEIGQREVTFADWDACVLDQGCTKNPSDEGWGRGDRPVINVSWDDIKEYLRWINRLTGKEYRLPSEAEWEYAARAGTTTPFSTGTCITTDQANYDGTFEYAGCGRPRRHQSGANCPDRQLPAQSLGTVRHARERQRGDAGLLERGVRRRTDRRKRLARR
jgi:formylglycine-generating enzyme required for sulfatase activity